jgi:replicative DNA helicase
MTLVPMLNIRRDEREPEAAPSNVDAEQSVLGAVLAHNDAFHLIDGLAPEHFSEPFHGVLWAMIAERVGKGLLAEPIGLMERFKSDGRFVELGGLKFLVDLVDYAPPPNMAAHYAAMVIEVAQRRALNAMGADIGARARSGVEAVVDVIGAAEAALLAMQATGRKTELMTAGAASARVLAYLDAGPEIAHGVKTGLAPLDEHIGPLLPGNLILLQGRPSMGKSAAAECIALNIAEAGAGVAQINGEMNEEEMAQRHLTDLCQRWYGFRGPEYRDIRRKRIGVDQRRMLQKAHEQLEQLPLVMLKRSGLKLAQLRSLARRQAVTWSRAGIPFGALIVDHVGLLKADQRMDRYEAQTEISNGLKELADELACPIIGLNQMNRESERRDDKRPQLSDLRDSGSWEQDADFVIGFYREAYYAARQTEPKGNGIEWSDWDRARKSRVVEAIILKARAGECSTVNLWGDVARNAIRGEPPEDGDLL